MRYEPKLRNAALAAALAFGASGALAVGGDLGTLDHGDTVFVSSLVSGTFSDTWLFDLSQPSTVSSTITAFSFGVVNITDFKAWLDGNPLTLVAAGVGQQLAGSVNLANGNDYQLVISGTAASGAAYTGLVTVTPIPEPGTYTMLLAGLGVVGFIAFRRRQDD